MALSNSTILDAAVQSIRTRTLSGEIFFRSVNLDSLLTLGFSPLDGTQTGKVGGRYNPPNSPPTTYLAGCQTLAAMETEQLAMISGHSPATSRPRLICGVLVDNAEVVDLTSIMVLSHFAIQKDDLLMPTLRWQQLNDKAIHILPQLLGAAIRDRPDIDGILYPPYITVPFAQHYPPGFENNLVLFMHPNKPSSPRRSKVILTIIDPGNLLSP